MKGAVRAVPIRRARAVSARSSGHNGAEVEAEVGSKITGQAPSSTETSRSGKGRRSASPKQPQIRKVLQLPGREDSRAPIRCTPKARGFSAMPIGRGTVKAIASPRKARRGVEHSCRAVPAEGHAVRGQKSPGAGGPLRPRFRSRPAQHASRFALKRSEHFVRTAALRPPAPPPSS